jgi:hypothetical protein
LIHHQNFGLLFLEILGGSSRSREIKEIPRDKNEYKNQAYFQNQAGGDKPTKQRQQKASASQ